MSFSAVITFRIMILFILCFNHFIKTMCASLSQVSCSNSSTVTPSSGSDSLLSPVGSISRPKSLTNSSLCSESATSSVSSLTSNYPKAPGFEREDQVHRLLSSALGGIQHIDNVGPDSYCFIGIFLSHCFIYPLIHYLQCHFSFWAIFPWFALFMCSQPKKKR